MPLGELAIGGPRVRLSPAPVRWKAGATPGTAAAVKESRGDHAKGGAYKPAVRPTPSRGWCQRPGILAEAREVTGLPVVTEIMDRPWYRKWPPWLMSAGRLPQHAKLRFAPGCRPFLKPVLLKRAWRRLSRNGCWPLNTSS